MESPLRIPEGRGRICRYIVAGLFLALSCAVICFTLYGLCNGKAYLSGMTRYISSSGVYYYRVENPGGFWFAIVIDFSIATYLGYLSVAEIMWARRRCFGHKREHAAAIVNGEPPTLRNLTKEVFRDGYFERAQQRAARRKSPWNLVLILAVFGCIFLCWRGLMSGMWYIHTLFYPEHVGRFSEFWRGTAHTSVVPSFLLGLPLIFAPMPLGMLLANYIMWCIPPARRVLDREAQGVKWASFREAQSGLIKVALIVVPICLVLSFIGAVTLKHP